MQCHCQMVYEAGPYMLWIVYEDEKRGLCWSGLARSQQLSIYTLHVFAGLGETAVGVA